VVATAIAFATLDMLRFRPGGDFSTPTARFLFTLVLWGGALLALGTGPLALVLAPFLRHEQPVRLPALVGVLFAFAMVSFAGLGIAGPLVAAGIAAVLVLPLVFVLARRPRPATAPGA